MINRIKTFFSPQRSKSVRNHLEKSLERGPIYDFKEITNTNGKVWNNLLNEDAKIIRKVPSKLMFGNMLASDIFKRSKITLLAISYSTFSDPAVETFMSQCPPSVTKILVRPILNPLKWILWSKLIGTKENSFAIFGDVPEAIETFRMENKYAGYNFLIDSMGLIRWKAAGPASAEELIEFHNTINNL